jgi:hypothetical protein
VATTVTSDPPHLEAGIPNGSSQVAVPPPWFDAVTKPQVVGRVVTATITLACVLIVYDGWTNLRFRDAAGIIIGPVLALFFSHVFSGTLVQHLRLGRRPVWREWLVTVYFESRFLLLAVPPLAILVIMDLSSASLSDAIRVIVSLEALSLSFWAGLAGQRSGLHGWSLALAALAGLVVGVFILGLQVFLEPGTAT